MITIAAGVTPAKACRLMRPEGGVITGSDFLRGQEHHCPYSGAPRLANGECKGCGTLVVRKVGDGEGVMVAEGEVECSSRPPTLWAALATASRLPLPPWRRRPLTPSVVYDASNKNLGIKPPILRSSPNRLTQLPIAQGVT